MGRPRCRLWSLPALARAPLIYVRFDMYKAIALVLSAIFCPALAGCSKAEPVPMTPHDLGILVRNEGCEKAETAVNRQTDPVLFLGIMYEAGLCRSKDPAKALDHYRLSARKGNDQAMYAFFVLSGRSDAPWTSQERKQHFGEAMEFLQRSAHLGNRDAAYALSVCLEHGACGLKKDLAEAQRLRAYSESKNQPNSSYMDSPQKQER